MKKLAFVIGLLSCSSLFADPTIKSSSALWQDIAKEQKLQQRVGGELEIKARSLILNESGLKQLLTGSNPQSTAARKIESEAYKPEIELPLPDGSFIRLRAISSPILSPEVAEQYPEIKTWRVQGIEDQAVSGRLDFTSKGFHGMLTLSDGDTIYIDPDAKSDQLYHSLSKKQNVSHFKSDFNCQVHDQHSILNDSTVAKLAGKKPEQASIAALDLITYRLAVAATAEYTSSQGGTPASAYASMVTTVNRVNEIYQRDLGIQFNLVTTDSLAYTDASTDPYTNNSTPDLVEENIRNLSAMVGSSNYDLGHVFAQGNIGGLAYVGVACDNNYKAGGATGTPNPQGETFSIEYVAHEMGHQLGATHTFNSQISSCSGGNRTPETAVEPGSGSSIMSYSGICGSDNLQNHSDAMFHSVSINQINSHTRSLNNCGVESSTGNQKPSASAGSDGIVPINTPFILDGSATGGTTYAWDQTDAGKASTVDVDLGNNAIIRTFLPSSSATRFIPNLSDLFAGTTRKGEKLPQTVRDLNFDFVVRDGDGGVDTDDKKISVKDTGSIFRVLSHGSSEIIKTGNTTSVAWSTAKTNFFPISCNNVDIKLLRVDGKMNTLKLNTPNDGSEPVIVPSSTPLMSNARIMVACSNQPFFQISSGNITVQQGSVTSDTTPPVITLNGSASISITQGESYTDAGATAVDNEDGTVNVKTTGSVDTSKPAVYTITYTATDSAGNTSTTTRKVTVVQVIDTQAPTITLNGSESISVSQGESYHDLGATAVDNIDGSVNVSLTGSVNTAVLGEYILTYTATDSSGNTATKIRTVTVSSNVTVDTTPPEISINGSAHVSIFLGDNYSDAGATATDNRDGSVNVTIHGSVDTNKLGTYTITYTAVDSSGNKATAIRTVSVNLLKDTIPPVISLLGANKIQVIKGSRFSDPGAVAVDNVDSVVSVSVSGRVNITVVGDYTLTYTAQDKAGNTATKTRHVLVVEKVLPDNIAPVITLNGDSLISTVKGEYYIELGATAVDDRDGIVNVVIAGVVNTSKLGSYNITYRAVDAAGNSALKTRKVIVTNKADIKPPVITLEGEDIYHLEVGQAFTDPGFSAFDDIDGIISVSVTGTVDTTKEGTYILSYTATDAAGNTIKKTRTVIIDKKSNGEPEKVASSGGGSIGYLLFPLIFVGLRRKKITRTIKTHNYPKAN